jgi:2-amino-4-hydroxy-6-hydroxymethyldihydropteridine diphosphokinase
MSVVTQDAPATPHGRSTARSLRVGVETLDRILDLTGEIAVSRGRLATLLDNLKSSHYHDTVAVGVPGPQPRFLNATAVGETTLPARALLDALLAIERERGRERPHANAPRTLDLDLLLYGQRRIHVPGLTVPHPRMHQRAFVLKPLVEISPEASIPGLGPAKDFLKSVENQIVEKLA